MHLGGAMSGRRGASGACAFALVASVSQVEHQTPASDTSGRLV
jgi:hypothetical protein